ncbi:MAG: Rrf2 family transcriptional regulator [Saprospiraceae bacterium]|nr:Rrf2 family transcriptional regulator [Lewinella sp.]
MFSKACEYGIRAALYIATQSLQDERVMLKEIAQEINSPEAFTAKILQQLSRHQIVDSLKGPHGGFLIEKKRIDEIRLSEIVRAIDGDNIYRGCGLGLEQCNAQQPCPLHDKFVDIRNNLRKMLESTSLYELATGLEIGLTFLKREA